MIEYRCDTCQKVLVTSPEMGLGGAHMFSDPTAILYFHLRDTDHEQFSARGERTKVNVEVYEIEGVKRVDLSGGQMT